MDRRGWHRGHELKCPQAVSPTLTACSLNRRLLRSEGLTNPLRDLLRHRAHVAAFALSLQYGERDVAALSRRRPGTLCHSEVSGILCRQQVPDNGRAGECEGKGRRGFPSPRSFSLFKLQSREPQWLPACVSDGDNFNGFGCEPVMNAVRQTGNNKRS